MDTNIIRGLKGVEIRGKYPAKEIQILDNNRWIKAELLVRRSNKAISDLLTPYNNSRKTIQQTLDRNGLAHLGGLLVEDMDNHFFIRSANLPKLPTGKSYFISDFKEQEWFYLVNHNEIENTSPEYTQVEFSGWQKYFPDIPISKELRGETVSFSATINPLDYSGLLMITFWLENGGYRQVMSNTIPAGQEGLATFTTRITDDVVGIAPALRHTSGSTPQNRFRFKEVKLEFGSRTKWCPSYKDFNISKDHYYATDRTILKYPANSFLGTGSPTELNTRPVWSSVIRPREQWSIKDIGFQDIVNISIWQVNDNLLTLDTLDFGRCKTHDISKYTETGELLFTLGTATYGGMILRIPNLQPSTPYSLSFEYLKTSGKLVSFGGHTDPVYATNTCYLNNKPTNRPFAQTNSIFEDDSKNDWNVVHVIFQTPKEIKQGQLLYIQPNRGYNEEVGLKIKRLKFEVGEKVTKWNYKEV